MLNYLYYFLIAASLLSCAKKTYLADTRVSYHRIEHASVRVDTQIVRIIRPYKVKVDEAMGEVIGYCEGEMTKAKPTSLLTNWMADALLTESNQVASAPVSAVVLNYGGVRVTSMPAGNWTVGHIYELMPFDNILYVVAMKGTQLQQLCDHIAAAGGWPVSHTLQFSLYYGKASDVRIGGNTLDTAAVYRVALPDYIFNGGDNVTFLKDCPVENTGLLIRDLYIRHVRTMTAAGQRIKGMPDARIR